MNRLLRIIEEADAEIAARQPEREPHYLRPVQASLLPAIPQRETTPETPEFTPARGVAPSHGGEHG